MPDLDRRCPRPSGTACLLPAIQRQPRQSGGRYTKGMDPILPLALRFAQTAASYEWFDWPSLPDLFPSDHYLDRLISGSSCGEYSRNVGHLAKE